jgi:hypothetical protein
MRNGLVSLAVFLTIGAFAAAPAGAVVGAASWALTVDKTWSAGSITGSGTDGDGVDWSIDCGGTCGATINNACAFDPDFHDVVCEAAGAVLTAADGNGYAFQSWSGCASVSGPDNRDCNLTSGTDANPYATFADVQPPTASLSAPTAGQLVSGTVPIGADWSDNSDNIWAARFYVRGALVAQSNLTPFTRDFDSTTVADGPALIEATVEDTHGNVSAPASATVMIDNNPPTISGFSGPVGSTPSFTWVAADSPGSGIKSVECKLDAGSFAPCSSSSGQSYGQLALGQHTFTLRVTDDADRVTTRSATWTVGPPPPAATSSPEPPATGQSPAEPQTPDQPTAHAAIAAKVVAKWAVKRGKTRVKKLALRSLPLGATVKVACKGGGCPFKAKQFSVRNGSLDLRRRFKKALGQKATITITITKPGMRGQVIRYVTRKRRAPRYSATASPEPPSSAGKSLSLGSPSFIGSTVDS